MDFQTFVRKCTDSLPKWYTKSVHKNVLTLLNSEGKLQAVKYLVELSNVNQTRETYGLKWAKEEVIDVIVYNVQPKEEAKLRYLIVGDNNFWYHTTVPITEKQLKEIIKDMKLEIHSNEYTDEPFKPNSLFAYPLHEKVENIRFEL